VAFRVNFTANTLLWPDESRVSERIIPGKNYQRKKQAADPFKQFARWWKQALAAKIVEPNAMTLATASADGLPSARIVLLKDFNKNGFVFFTNYESYKGRQLSENPKACLVFFWKDLERQVRITGLVEKTDPKISEEYFHSRPAGSQVGRLYRLKAGSYPAGNGWRNQYKQSKKEIAGGTVPRPVHWGGYLVKPVIIEFWQGRPSRLHDRLQYSLLEDGSWKMERLAP
jgi:pyridoxamine 5'-phosphate oxidase